MTVRFIKENWLCLIGGAAGAVGGYLYHIYMGCGGGSCPVTSSPVMSVVWGALVGGLSAGMFKKDKNRNSDVSSDKHNLK